MSNLHKSKQYDLSDKFNDTSRYLDDTFTIDNPEFEKKEEIWLSPLTKAPIPTEKSQKHRDNMKNATKTSITQQLLTDLGRSVGVTAVNPTGVVRPVYERSTFPLTATAV